MIPILFKSDATDFTTNGIGRLTDAISCTVTEERNGQYELEMQYPMDGQYYSEIKTSSIIAAIPYDGAKIQAFQVYKVSRAIGGRVTINAQHISYRLNWIPVMPFSASSLADTLEKIKVNSAEINPFTFDADFTSTVSCGVTIPTGCKTVLGGVDGSVLDTYGGEYEWDNFAVKLHRNRGSEKPITLLYGKNITDLTQEEVISNTYTGVCPYWSATDNNITVTLPEKVISVEEAKNFPFYRTKVVDFSGQFDAQPTIEQLREATTEYIEANNIGVPDVSIEVSFINLAGTDGYEDAAPLETVQLGDTISVYFEKLGVQTRAKVIGYEYNVLTEKYENVSIGTSRSTLASTIVEQGKAAEEMARNAVNTANKATEWLTNGKGYVMAVKNKDGSWKELLFLDQPTTAAATKVLRINENGIGFAGGPAGTFDSWVYHQAWTLDGEFTTGGNNNSLGSIHVLDSAGHEIVGIDNTGIVCTTYEGDTEKYKVSMNSDAGVIVESAADGQYSQLAQDGLIVVTEDSEFNETATLGSGSLILYDKNDPKVQSFITTQFVEVSDSSNTTQVQPDGIYTNGVKLETSTNGWSGYFTTHDYPTGKLQLTFENGVLIDVDDGS